MTPMSYLIKENMNTSGVPPYTSHIDTCPVMHIPDMTTSMKKRRHSI